MHFHVITLFPEVCKAYTDASILGRAQKTKKGKGAKQRGKKITVSYYDIRAFSKDKHRKTDDRPYGGGPGMVMMPEPLMRAYEKAVGRKDRAKVKTLIMSPRGRQFDQGAARKLADTYEHIVIISGRYEGIDARVKKLTNAEEVSVGPYVLTGGELPALSVIDAVSRQVPGVLGTHDSLEDERIASGELYTRPADFTYRGKTYRVPKVLMEGDHKKIDAWRKTRSV